MSIQTWILVENITENVNPGINYYKVWNEPKTLEELSWDVNDVNWGYKSIWGSWIQSMLLSVNAQLHKQIVDEGKKDLTDDGNKSKIKSVHEY